MGRGENCFRIPVFDYFRFCSPHNETFNTNYYVFLHYQPPLWSRYFYTYRLECETTSFEITAKGNAKGINAE